MLARAATLVNDFMRYLTYEKVVIKNDYYTIMNWVTTHRNFQAGLYRGFMKLIIFVLRYEPISSVKYVVFLIK